jgi:hypothetical protein
LELQKYQRNRHCCFDLERFIFAKVGLQDYATVIKTDINDFLLLFELGFVALNPFVPD